MMGILMMEMGVIVIVFRRRGGIAQGGLEILPMRGVVLILVCLLLGMGFLLILSNAMIGGM